MSSSEERVGGVEPETVTGCGAWIQSYGMEPGKCGEVGVCVTCWEKREGLHVPTLQARLALVEEELRDWETAAKCSSDALRECEEELRQAREREGSLNRCIDALEDRGCAREGELMALEAAAVEHEDVKADRDRLAEALDSAQEFIETVTQWTGTHPDEREEVLATIDAALSPVQGEHHAQPEGESQMDDNNLNHLIGERDAMKWVDGFLTVVPDADRDLMHTWFACAIESGRMTVQGEHEQDGEDAGDSTEAVTFHRALCSKCGDSWDGDGLEFASSPERAVETALIEGGLRREDGLLVCDDCRGEIAQDGDTEETT